MFGKNLFRSDDSKPAATGGPTAAIDRPKRTPTVVLRENEAAILIDVDLPGVKADHLQLSVDSGVLTIHGTVSEPGRSGFTALHREYESADFHRTLTLPDNVDAGAISASSRNGVVTISLPKAKPVQARRIAVTTG